MTSPMTPTEQDKELQNWLVEHTALIEETGGAVWRELEVETFMYHLRELITADRKRVANADREVLKDLVVRAAPDGTQDDGDFVGFYVLPTGSVHRAIAYFQDKGGIETLGDASVISRYQAHLKRVALEARIEEWKSMGDFLTKADKRALSREFLDLYRLHGERLKAEREEV